MEKKQIEKMDLVNDIDRLFYDIKNIEDQASVFRSILRLNDRSILKGIKAFIKDKAYIEPKKPKATWIKFKLVNTISIS